MAHFFLGHLGHDEYLRVPDRSFLDHQPREIEAESVSYLICRRAGVRSEAEKYLAGFVKQDFSPNALDVYGIMKAAGSIETALGISHRSRRA